MKKLKINKKDIT